MTRSGSEKRGDKIGIHESGRRGKRKVDEVQKDSSSKRHKSESSVAKQSTKKLEICDLDPPPTEMTMPYMIQMRYKKPVPPNQSHGKKRNGDSINRSVHRAGTSTKPSIRVMQVVDELRNYFKGQISNIQSENWLLSKQLQAMQSQVLSLKSDQQKKLKLFVRMQEIMNKFRENSRPEIVGGSGSTSENSPEVAPSSGLPVKRAPKLAKALQSPYVVDEVKQMKSSGNVVVFEHYNQNVDDADVDDFQN
ncbi:Hypothetical predicted protein [Olea europaea subsp. europaea]|uniref:Uncharacterized protein n=1 Tax=Olea europaea subsp. europaea TaxID=158383 RepID=A0A8S0QKF8_OLEEU|nr:Hypothetical predicted protein [Olea europaea subsp. europaea]